MRGTLIISLIIAVLAVIFALANPQEMEVNLLFTTVFGSTALVLILTFAIGVIVGVLATLPSRFHERKKRKELEKSMGQREAAFPPETGEAPEPPPESSGSGSRQGFPLGKKHPDQERDS